MIIPYSKVVHIMHEQYITDKRNCNHNLEVYQSFRDHMTHLQWNEVLQFLGDSYAGMNPQNKAQLVDKTHKWYGFIDNNGLQDMPYEYIVQHVNRNKKLIKQFYSASWGLVVMAIETYDHHDNYPHFGSKTMFNELFHTSSPRDDDPFAKQKIGQEYSNLMDLLRKNTPPLDDHPGLN